MLHVSCYSSDPEPKDIAGYLIEIAQYLDECPKRLRVEFHIQDELNHPVMLDFTADGKMRLTVAERKEQIFGLRSRWIAEHLVPLVLNRAVLYIEPVEAGRFRVFLAPPRSLPTWLLVLDCICATVGVITLSPELMATAIAITIGIAVKCGVRSAE